MKSINLELICNATVIAGCIFILVVTWPMAPWYGVVIQLAVMSGLTWFMFNVPLWGQCIAKGIVERKTKALDQELHDQFLHDSMEDTLH